MTTTPTSAASSAAYYPTPAFQNHIEQLGKLTERPSSRLVTDIVAQSKNTTHRRTWSTTRSLRTAVDQALTLPDSAMIATSP